MKDLIKKILKEETEVKEMGISMRKVRASQPKNYLVKSLIDKEKSEESRSELKKMVKKCNNLYSEIDNELRNLKWEDINFYEPNKFFYVMLEKCKFTETRILHNLKVVHSFSQKTSLTIVVNRKIIKMRTRKFQKFSLS